MNLHISVDSAANYRELGVLRKFKDGSKIDGSVVALTIYNDEVEFIDNADIDTTKLVEYLDSAKSMVHTACMTSEEWKKYFEGHDNVICITLTGALSGCNSSCMVAALQYMEEHPESHIYVLDTKSIGPVQKLCVEYATELATQLSDRDKPDSAQLSGGHKPDEAHRVSDTEQLFHELEDYCYNRTGLAFCLRSLKNLANNGRINKAVAALVQTLKICIVGGFNEEGTLEPKNKVRGDAKALSTIYNNIIEDGYKGGRIRIDHCFAEDCADKLAGMIRTDWPDADIIIGETTGICSFYAEKGGLIVGYEK